MTTYVIFQLQIFIEKVFIKYTYICCTLYAWLHAYTQPLNIVYILALSVPDEGYSRNASCALHLIYYGIIIFFWSYVFYAQGTKIYDKDESRI
jgi:hypothetical protein